jgi:uncharacterized protein
VIEQAMAESSPPTHVSFSQQGPVPAIDRLSASTRPQRWAVMRQKWRDLLFLHWAVDAEGLRRHVPAELDLDLFEGSAYVGLVFFTMTGVRPVGLPPVWGLSSFHETNLRTYVRLGNRDPGVWFFNLEAANSIAVLLARALFHLPYHRSRMFLEQEPTEHQETLGLKTMMYAGVRQWPGPIPASYCTRASVGGPTWVAEPGTLDHFLIERYILYSRKNDRLFQGRVHHLPYPVQSANIDYIHETLLSTWNVQKSNAPPLVHFSTGVDVEVFALDRVAISFHSGSEAPQLNL